MTSKPPSPNLKPLLTSRADTPMLGAQARAAELAAASAAKQRQVSRELEERQLPPNPAVSLSAFTKPQLATSRNKGNKNWKPLILDDIVETDDASTSDPTASTPSNTDRLTSKEASDKRIPTGPRAMVVGRSLSTVVAYPQPPKLQASPVNNMPARHTPQGYGSAQHGGIPYPVFAQNMYLPQPMFVAGIPMNDTAPYHTFGSMMVPDDISPTKQEQKLSMLENVPLPHLAAVHHGMMQHDDPFSHGPTQTYGQNQQYMWDPPGHDAYYHGYQLPLQRHIGGSYENESDGGYTNSHLPQAPIQRSNPAPARIESAANRRTVLPIRRNSGQQTSHESPVRYQEPYDTERAMKECVNKLKEKAKDGKTVLHNPNIHKEQPRSRIMEPNNVLEMKPMVVQPSSNTSLPVPWDVRPKDSDKQGSDWEVMPPPADQTLKEPSPFADCENDLNFIKPAPGLPLPSTFGPPQLSLDSSNMRTRETSAAPQVGSAEWMRLAPITTAERDRVRQCMALAAKSVTNDVPGSTITSDQNKEDLSATRNWFHTDARGERLLREQVDLSAQAYASQVIANIKDRNGGELPEQFKDGKDDGLAATLILGNVACNLQTYLVGDRKSVEQRRNFHKVTSVPDWCTERGGLSLGGLGAGDSYFDGAAGGFYGAPVRVARDPRFRPQLKEGMKVKPEEEWKNRHEMYGRRMM